MGRPRNGQIGSLGDVLGTLDGDVLGTSWGPIFGGWVGSLGASLLGNLLAGKGIVRAGSRNKKGKGFVRAGYGNKTDFYYRLIL